MNSNNVLPVIRHSVKDELKELILKSLQDSYTSRSCKDGIVTGNHYQSIKLGEMQTSGFRSDRSEILNQINFSGKKVLDLGSNLGELSRSARARGAFLVDGFEYDEYFLEVAHMINVYNQSTRVSFYQRDITDHSIYNEHYDIVLAFSVFTYISTVLKEIHDITDQILIIETHKLEENLESGYLNHVLKYFTYYKILGQSDWGVNQDSKETRAIIAFAKDETMFSKCLLRSEDTPSLGGGGTPSARDTLLDKGEQSGLSREGIRTAVRTEKILQTNKFENNRYLDVMSTCLQERFFSFFDFHTVDGVFKAVLKLHIDLDVIARSIDCTRYVYSGWVYWFLFTKGYLQYVDTGSLDHNIYREYLEKYYFPRGHDPGLEDHIGNPQLISQRIERRFQDFDLFRMSQHATGMLEHIAPIDVYVSDSDPENELSLHDSETGVVFKAARVDGWHRLFAAKLCGVDRLRYRIVPNLVLQTS